MTTREPSSRRRLGPPQPPRRLFAVFSPSKSATESSSDLEIEITCVATTRCISRLVCIHHFCLVTNCRVAQFVFFLSLCAILPFYLRKPPKQIQKKHVESFWVVVADMLTHRLIRLVKESAFEDITIRQGWENSNS